MGDDLCHVAVSLSGATGSSESRGGDREHNTRQMQEHCLWKSNPTYLDVFYEWLALNKEPMTISSSDVTTQTTWTKEKKFLLQCADATCWTCCATSYSLSFTICKASGAIWRSQTQNVCVCVPVCVKAQTQTWSSYKTQFIQQRLRSKYQQTPYKIKEEQMLQTCVQQPSTQNCSLKIH